MQLPIGLLAAQVAVGAVCVAWISLPEGRDSLMAVLAIHAAVVWLLFSALDRDWLAWVDSQLEAHRCPRAYVTP